MSSAGDPRSPGSRRGFTLVELLVVIGIMMLLMGITVGAFVSRPRTDAMIGAEQALADAIRQARHTARSSGQPVVLRLKKSERQIAGLVREPLWQRAESWPKAEASGSLFTWPGRSGTGLLIPEAYIRTGTFSATQLLLPFADGSSDPEQPLRLGRRLWRGATNPNATVMLSVACKPPIADGVGQSCPDILPLAMVVEDGKVDLEDALMGILLVDTAYTASSGTITRAANQAGVAPSWEVLAWVGKGTARRECSSIQDALTTGGAPPPQTGIVQLTASTTLKGVAEAGPTTGGTWTEFTLLYDFQHLRLFRNGVWIADVSCTATVTDSQIQAERVILGYADIGSVPYVANGCVLDDVRLERLGDAMAGSFPNGVAPKLDQRITCLPDGRVEIDAISGGTIALESTSGPSATLTINAVGSVTSQVDTKPQVTP